jgi:hypothetical protein
MASVVTQAFSGKGRMKVLTIDVTAHTDGSVTPTELLRFQGRIVAIETDPGTPAPTDDYDITLMCNGVDRLSTVGTNRDTANTERAAPTSPNNIVSETEALTFTVANQSVNGARFVTRLFIIPVL